MTETYCGNEDVEHRLALGDHYTAQVEQIRDVRERAYRWIRHKFAEQGKGEKLPDPSEELPVDFEILKDIEATRAAYLYKRDQMEWASEPSSQLQKMENWKDDSEEMLKQLIKRKWGDEFYAFSGS